MMSGKPEEKALPPDEDEPSDAVTEAGKESFPASDPPPWTPLQTGRRDKPGAVQKDRKRKP